MKQHYIQFKKQRELGEILNETFVFFRENFKSLFGFLVKRVGLAFILLVLAVSYYSYTALKFQGGDGIFSAIESEADMGQFFISAIILLLAVLFFMSMLYSSVLNYIKSYVNHHGAVQEEEVKQNMKHYVPSLAGLFILVFLMLIFGFALCVIPGVYLAVPLGLTFSILVFEDKGVFESIEYSFKLVKDNWWITFASFLVLMLIVYVIGLVFSLPLFIYTAIKAITMVQQGSSADPAALFDWVYVLLNVLSTLAQYLLYVITIIGTSFIYFNLKEKKYHTGSFETIENLGRDTNA